MKHLKVVQDVRSKDEHCRAGESTPFFQASFAELVWGDGTHIERQIIPLTDTTVFGTRNFKIPFHAEGKKWVRLAVWDSAGNGAWLQPIALKQ